MAEESNIPAMANEENQQNEKKSAAPTRTWPGSVRRGQFWCDCEPPNKAKCRPTRKENKNKGRKFWSCLKGEDDGQCDFFIWDDEASEAKAWLVENGPQEPPETPSKPDKSPKSDETPWTIAAKRRPVSREISDESENGGPSNWKQDDGDVFEMRDEGDESPSRKAAKKTRFSTPRGQALNARPKESALPTPNSGDKGKGKAIEVPFQAENTCPTPCPADDAILMTSSQTFNERLREARVPIPMPDDKAKGNVIELPATPAEHFPPKPGFANIRSGQAGNLTARVMRLLRNEKFPLKDSTELQIRHEIDLELDLHAAKVRRCEETILKQSEKIDELETLASHLTGIGSGDGSMDDPIEV